MYINTVSIEIDENLIVCNLEKFAQFENFFVR